MTMKQISIDIQANTSQVVTALNALTKVIASFAQNTTKNMNTTQNAAKSMATHTINSMQMVNGQIVRTSKVFKNFGHGFQQVALKTATTAKQSFGMVMKQMLNLQAFMGKIIHYITFSIGVQLVMGVRQGITAVIDSIKELESSATNAATVAGYLGASFSKVRDKIIEASISISKNAVFSVTEVAKSFYSLASAGIDVVEVMDTEFIPTIIDLATATGAELDLALQTVTKTMKQFNLELEDSQDIVDSFMTVIANTYATIDKLAEGMKYVGSIAGVLNQDLDTVNASLGVLYNRGLEGGQAGQRLNMIFTKLLKPTDKAKGVFDELGISLNDINPKTHDLVEILYTLQAANFGAAEASSVFRARTAGTAAMLVDSADAVADLVTQIKLSGGITQNVADKQLESLNNKLKLLANRANASSMEFRKTLIPAMSYLADVAETTLIPGIESIAKTFESVMNVLRIFKPLITGIIPIIFSLGSSLISLYLAGRLVLFFLTTSTAKAITAASGFMTLGAAIKGTLASSFILASTFSLIAMGAGDMGPTISALIPLILALNLAYRLHITTLGVLAKAKMLQFVLDSRTTTIRAAEAMSLTTLTGAYIKLHLVKLRTYILDKKDLAIKYAKAAANVILTVGILAYAGVMSIVHGAKIADIILTITSIGVTWGLTAAQWALNIAMYACPLVWLLAGIAAVVAVAAIFIAVLSMMNEKEEEQQVLTEEMTESFGGYNKAVSASIDINKKLADSHERLILAESELDKIREEGISSEEEYTLALDEHRQAYEEYMGTVEASAEVNQSFLDASANVVQTFRAHSEALDDIITKTSEIISSEIDYERLLEKIEKTLYDRNSAMEEYANILTRYSSDTEEAADAREKLADAESEYWSAQKDAAKTSANLLKYEQEKLELSKDLTDVDKKRLEIVESVMNLEREYLTLESERIKLLTKEKVLVMHISETTKIYEERLKSVWEMQLKVYEAELALYKLQKEKPALMDELFDKMAEYGMLTDDIIDAYVALKEAEAEQFKARIDYFKATEGMSSEELDGVSAVITKYQELLKEGLNPALAWAQAMESTGFGDFGFDAATIASIQEYAYWEYEVGKRAQEMQDLVAPVLDALGGLNMGDLPADLKEIWTQILKLIPEGNNLVGDFDDSINELIGSWKGFAETTAYVWRGLQDGTKTFTQTFGELVTKLGLSGVASEFGGATGLLEHMLGKTTVEIESMSDEELLLATNTAIAGAAMLNFADDMKIDISGWRDLDDVMNDIAKHQGLDVATPFATVEGFVGTLLPTLDSMVDVVERLEFTIRTLNTTMFGMQKMQQGVSQGWETMSPTSLFDEWTRIAFPELEGDVQTAAGEAHIDEFVQFIYDTVPTEYSTKMIIDFAEAHLDIAAFSDLSQGNIIAFMQWMTDRDIDVSELIDSEAFKSYFEELGPYAYNELSEFINENRDGLSINILTKLEDKPFIEGVVEFESKILTMKQFLIDNPGEWPVNIMFGEEKTEEKYFWDSLYDIIFGGTRGFGSFYQAKGGVSGLQTGMAETKGAQLAMIGEAGAEAVVPLEGANKKYGRNILQNIIPKYFPDLAFMQEGGVVGGPATGIFSKFEDFLTILRDFALSNKSQLDSLLAEFSSTEEDLEIDADEFNKRVKEGSLSTKAILINIANYLKATFNNLANIINDFNNGISRLLEEISTIITELGGLSSNIESSATVFYDTVILAAASFSNQVAAVGGARSTTPGGTPGGPPGGSSGGSSGHRVDRTYTKEEDGMWHGYVISSSGESRLVAGDHDRDKLIDWLMKNYPRQKSLNWAEGGIASKPTFGMFGEAGAEALIPLEGRNKKFGKRILESIIPSYYPELMKQGGGVYGGSTSTTNYGDSYKEDYTVTGPITVQAQDPVDFMNQLKNRYRTTR